MKCQRPVRDSHLPQFRQLEEPIDLALKGRMPVSKFMPHQWYATPNIHFCTVKDFDALCYESQIKILKNRGGLQTSG